MDKVPCGWLRSSVSYLLRVQWVLLAWLSRAFQEPLRTTLPVKEYYGPEHITVKMEDEVSDMDMFDK